MAEIVVEPFKVRLKRFEEGVSRKQLWDTQLRQVYKFVAPNRNIMSTNNTSGGSATNIAQEGENRMREIYDATAIEGAQSFANNLQSTLMPIYQRWATYEPAQNVNDLGEAFETRFGEITEQSLSTLTEQIQSNMDTLFKYFASSNLYQASNEMFIDLVVGTGALLVQEGDDDNPLKFSSVPVNDIIIIDSPSQPIRNIGRELAVPHRDIMKLWPDAKLSSTLSGIIKDTPDTIIQLKEVVWHYPENAIGKQFYLSVWTSNKEEIVTRFMKDTDWLIPRFSKSPGEVYGRGPAMTALPFIRVLNKFTEYFLRSAQWQVSPAFVASNIGDINPFTLRIEPGSIIPLQQNIGGQSALSPIDFGGNFEFSLNFIQQLQQNIKEIMFANPLPPSSQPTQTATEITIRQQNWVQQNAGTFPRLVNEFFQGLIDKSLAILESKGLIKPLTINDIPIETSSTSPLLKLNFTSPLANIQKLNDFNNINAAVQWVTETFGGIQGLLALNIEKLPEDVFKLLNIPQDLINQDFATSPLIQQLKGILNQGGEEQQPPPPEPGLTGEAAPENIGALSSEQIIGGIGG